MNHDILKRVIFDQHQIISGFQIVDRDIQLEKEANYVLVGLRRAGKTTLLYKRVQDLIKESVEYNQIIYINFDDERLINFKVEDFEDIIEVADELSTKKHYFFFDEIQNIDGWEKFAIRIANQGYKVDITGSNAKMLSREVEAKLGGRYISREVLPYSFREYLLANKIAIDYSTKNEAKTNLLLEKYFVNGGLPALIGFSNKKEYVSSVYQKVFYGDIVVHNKVRSENGMKLLIKKIAETIGQDISFTKLQNIITGIGYKISKDVIIDYCSYCKNSFLLFTLENYYSSFVDKQSNLKYYFRDNGILNLFVDDKRSSLIENIVAITLYRKASNNLYYLKGNKVDIDFFVSDLNQAYQVAYSINEIGTYEREIDNLIRFASSRKEKTKLYIVTFDEDRLIKKGSFEIEVISLKKFLLS